MGMEQRLGSWAGGVIWEIQINFAKHYVFGA
jgi:hypothetical protein